MSIGMDKIVNVVLKIKHFLTISTRKLDFKLSFCFKYQFLYVTKQIKRLYYCRPANFPDLLRQCRIFKAFSGFPESPQILLGFQNMIKYIKNVRILLLRQNNSNALHQDHFDFIFRT